MNPYTYGKRGANSARRSANQTGTASSAISSWTKAIFCSPINSLAALLFVLFAASSVAGMAFIAAPEIGSAVEPSPHVAMVHPSVKLLGYSGRVLGDSTSAPRIGQLVYNPGNLTVYLVGQNGLYGIPNVAVFNSWGWTFSQIIQANSAEQALSQIGIVSMKQTGCNTPLDQIAGTCGGTSVSSNNSDIRIGQLVYNPGNLTVYLVGQNGLYGIPNVAVFNSWGWTFSQIIQANSAEQVLSQIGVVPMMQAGCNSPIDQINGICGTSNNTTHAPTAPTMSLGPSNNTVIVNTSQQFNFISTAADNNPLTFRIDWGDGTVPTYPTVQRTGSGAYIVGATHTWTGIGSCIVSVNVSDGKSDPVLSTFHITIISSQSNGGPVISSFVATPSTITAGQSSVLSWQVSSGAILSIDNGIGSVNGKTSLTVYPTQTTTYTLTAYYGGTDGPSPSATKTVTVFVTSNTSSGVVLSTNFLNFAAVAGQMSPAIQYVNVYPNTKNVTNWTASVNAGTIPGLNLYSNNNNNTVGATVSGTGSGAFGVGVVAPFTAGNFTGSITVTSGGQSQTITVYLTVGNSSVSQPSVTIVSPNGGEAWTQGQTYQVTWQRTNFNDAVAINLIDYTPGSRYGLQYGITNGSSVVTTSGQTSFSWTIPSTIPAGNYYKVVVGMGQVNGFSSNYFTIVAPTAPTVASGISVLNISPVSGTQITPGGTATVNWNRTGDFSGVNNYYFVYLKNTSAQILGSAGYSGSYTPLVFRSSTLLYPNFTITIPSNQAAGSYYLEIDYADTNGNPISAGTSNPFSVSAVTVVPSNLQIVTSALPNATEGQPYTTQLQVSGGTAPYTWTTMSTTYPSGCCVLGLNGAGNTSPSYSSYVTFNTQSSATVINTYPGGTYYWTIQVQDAAGNTVTKTVSLTINSAPNIVVYTASPQSLSFSLTAGQTSSAVQTVTISSNNSNNTDIEETFNGSWVASGGSQTVGGISQSNPLTIKVYANNINNMAAGTYTGSISVTKDGAPMLAIPLTLTVQAPVVQPPYVSLSINSNSFSPTASVPASWTLSVSSNLPNAAVTICGAKSPAAASSSCTPVGNLGFAATTGSDGSWNASGSFKAGDGSAGNWSEYVVVGGIQSSPIHLTVNLPPAS